VQRPEFATERKANCLFVIDLRCFTRVARPVELVEQGAAIVDESLAIEDPVFILTSRQASDE
jgi:hypothetical protein